MGRWHHIIVGLGLGLLSGVTVTFAQDTREAAAETPFVFSGPCAELSAERWRSDACDAFMAAHPHPTFDPAVTYVAKRDNVARSRAIHLPEAAPPLPLAWMKRNWYFMDGPGVKPDRDDWTARRLVQRDNFFYLYQAVEVDEFIWYLIGPGQWMREDYLAVLHVAAVPEGVTGRWVAVDIAQQTLVAMDGATPVWGTLISSGDWFKWTSLGLFPVYGRAESLQIQGPPGVEPPTYNIRARWLLFFDDQQAIHSVNDHNLFGYPASHGCVNMVPGDAEWLWNFLNVNGDEWDADLQSFLVDVPEAAPHVLIYRSARWPQALDWTAES